jgi:predicted lipid-binding transport protein (Tim44 family)
MVVYTALRFGLFLLCFAVFYAAGMGLLWALALAALISGVAGYFLLARQRLTLGSAMEAKVEQVRARSAERTAREDAIADELIAQQQQEQHPDPNR